MIYLIIIAVLYLNHESICITVWIANFQISCRDRYRGAIFYLWRCFLSNNFWFVVDRDDVDTYFFWFAILDSVVGYVTKKITTMIGCNIIDFYRQKRRRFVTVVDVGEGSIRIKSEPGTCRIVRSGILHYPRQQITNTTIFIVTKHALFIGKQLQCAAFIYGKIIISAARRNIAPHPIVYPATRGEQ